MTIQRIYHKDLLNFLDSEAYKNSNYLPISQHRGVSHAHNPRAKPNDLVLVLVHDEGEMVGYLGVFPDDLHFPKGDGTYEIAHGGWLSCMWVNPLVRGKGIAKKLINTVFEAWDYRILVTEFTPAAKGLYDRTGQFVDLLKPVGLRGYRRLNLAYLLPSKNADKWARWRGPLSFVDACFNIFNSLRLALLPQKKPIFRYVAEVDEEAMQLIEKYRSPEELLRRDADDLRWMVRYPWLLSGIADESSSRYHFSSYARRFHFLNIKIYDKEEDLIGFVILSVRDNNLKVPYAYFAAAEVATVAVVIEQHLKMMKLDMLTVFHPLLVDYWQKNKGPFFMRRPLQRHYIISKAFGAVDGEVFVQDGDADAAFT